MILNVLWSSKAVRNYRKFHVVPVISGRNELHTCPEDKQKGYLGHPNVPHRKCEFRLQSAICIKAIYRNVLLSEWKIKTSIQTFSDKFLLSHQDLKRIFIQWRRDSMIHRLNLISADSIDIR